MSEIAVGPVADRRGVTEFLYGHSWNDDESRCECGWTHPESVEDSIEFDHSYHVAGALKEAFDIRPLEWVEGKKP